jgi:hypothetical protein
MFELFAFFARIFCAEAVCPNLIVRIVGKSAKSNSFQQDHLKPQAQDINLFATYIAHSKWPQSQYVHDRFAVRLPPCAAMA